VRNEQMKGRPFIPWTFLDGTEAQKPKDMRIRGLAPWFESGKVFFLRSCRNIDKLVQELLKFPRYTLKDIADALSIAEHIMYPRHRGAREIEDRKEPEWFKKLFNTKDHIGSSRTITLASGWS
jgi:hypothetical protein